MLTFATQHLAVPALLRLAAAMRATSRRMRAAARRLDAGFELRRTEAVARPVESSGERQVAVTGTDVRSLAWLASETYPPPAAALDTAAVQEREDGRLARVAFAMFLQVGLIGLGLAAAGVDRWLDAEAFWPTAAAMIVAGGALALAAWRCARIMLESWDDARGSRDESPSSDRQGDLH